MGQERTKWKLAILLLALLMLPCVLAQRPADPGHPASEVGGGMPFNGSYGNFTFPGDRALKIPTNTSCAAYTSIGDLCWDSNDDILYIGVSTSSPNQKRIYTDQEDLLYGNGIGTHEVRMYHDDGNVYWGVGNYFSFPYQLGVRDNLRVGVQSDTNDDCLFLDSILDPKSLCWNQTGGYGFNFNAPLSISDVIVLNSSSRMVRIGDLISPTGSQDYYGRYVLQDEYEPGFEIGESSTYKGRFTYLASDDYGMIGTTEAGTSYSTMYFEDDHLGINRANPETELDIGDGDDSDTNATLRMRTGTSSRNATIEFYEGTSTPVMALNYRALDNRLDIRDLQTDTTRFSFLRNGTLGVNNEDPDAILHVVGTLCVTNDTTCSAPANGDIYFSKEIRTGSAGFFNAGGCDITGTSYLNCVADSPQQNCSRTGISGLCSDEDLYVQEDLEVDGQVYLDNLPDATSVTGTGRRVYFDSTNNRLYYSTSSARYKKNITDLDDDFRRILLAEPKRFNRIENGHEDFGYIAEELEDVGLDQLVLYVNDDIPQGVSYEKTPIYVLEVVKEHRTEIEQLEQDIADIYEGLDTLGGVEG